MRTAWEQRAEPLTVLRQTVPPGYTDYNQHMADGYYLVVFDFATDEFFRWVGLDEAHRRERQMRQRGLVVHRGKIGPARKSVEQKAIEVVIVGRRNRTAGGKQRQRVGPRGLAGGGERTRFECELVRLVEQHRQFFAKARRQTVRLQLGCVSRYFLQLAPFSLDAGARRLQRLRGRSLVAPLALLVEMHRRRMQPQRQRRRLTRRGRPAEILRRQLGEAELRLAAHLPQEVGIDSGGDRLRIGKQYRRRRTGETQQHVRCLDLQAFAGNRFDLQRGIVIGEDGAGLERAVVLEKDMHGSETARRETRIIP